MKKVLTVMILITFLIIFLIKPSEKKHTANFNNKEEEEIASVPSEDWFEKQRAFPFQEIPFDEYLKSVEYVKQNMTVLNIDFNTAWNLAGPSNIEGRITAVAIHPFNPQAVYAGTANGGLWKSADFCQNWISVFDGQNTSSVGALAIDPLNPEILYCGTGEANSLRSYYPGTGIYKSTNSGNSWIHTGLDSSHCIGSIAVNPVNTNEVYAAAGGWLRRKNSDRGIYKSTDGGLTWIKKLYIADSVGAIDVTIDPVNPERVFAGMWERQRREDAIKYGGIKSGLYLSTDSGENWSQIAGGFPVNDATLGRISIDISKSNPAVMFALTSAASGGTKGLYKSVNSGTNWTRINSSAAPSSNFAWFNRICRIDPVNSERLFCGGIDMHFSENGGTSFGTVSSSHVDQHAAAFAPSNSNYIVIGNDGGIDYSTDGGFTWSASTSLPVTQFYAGEIDFHNPDILMGGTQDNGTVRTSGNISGWNSVYGGDGFYCLVDYSNSQNVYASSQNGGLGRSTNGGLTFSGAVTGLDLSFTNWMTPFVMDKNNPSVLYCGTYKIFRTTNGMQSWNAISPDLANGHTLNLGTITTVDVSESDPDVIYCGTDDANVWVTTNGGTVWNKINSGLPYRWVTRVAVHPDSANVCYVTLSGYKVDSTGSHIFRTANFGANWTSIKGNLPDAPVNDIIIDPLNTNYLYIATDINVMSTTNLGANWYILSNGIPSAVPCHDLTLHSPSRKLVVWTHGRSAFSVNLGTITGTPEINSGLTSDYKLFQNFPNPFNPSTYITYSVGKNCVVSLRVFDMLGREVSVLVNNYQEKGTYKTGFSQKDFSFQLPGGVYFYSLYLDGIKADTKKMLLLK